MKLSEKLLYTTTAAMYAAYVGLVVWLAAQIVFEAFYRPWRF